MNGVLHDKHSITPPVVLVTSASTSTAKLSTDELEEMPTEATIKKSFVRV